MEETRAVAQLIDTVVHELLHGLFFELTHLRRVPGLLDNIERSVQSLGVRLAASRLFDCPIDNVASVPLDYAGPLGTQGNHWAPLVLAGDIMSDFFNEVGGRLRQMSPITLALAEDTGWFMRRSSQQDGAYLRRGFRMGCSMLKLVLILE